MGVVISLLIRTYDDHRHDDDCIDASLVIVYITALKVLELFKNSQEVLKNS